MIPSHLFTQRRQLYVFFFTVPEIPPAEVSGGGGSRSELVITWDVSFLASNFLQRMVVFIETLL